MIKHYEFKDEYSGMICVTQLSEWMDREEEFQASLSETDCRHWEMFRFEKDDEGNDWFELFWSGRYGYPYELSRIKSPDDLLWLLVHLSEKKWPHYTGFRVGALIKAIARIKGWEQYKAVPHPNEAPKPNHSKIKERAKMTNALRYEVIKRDHHRCRSCGFSVADGAALHVDHIVPVSKGGRTDRSNLQTLCSSCNLGKANT